MTGHNESSSDSYVILNNLPEGRNVVNLIKNGAGIISLKIFNGYVDENKKSFHMFILHVEKYMLGVV